MKLFFYYCLYGFSNCYLIGEDEEPAGGGKRRALIVDPGSMDEKIVGFIEDNDYDLRAVLVTHDHMNHVHGLRTLKRIYDVEVFAGDPTVCEERATLVKDGDRLELGSFAVDVFSVPGHSSDSVVYRIDPLPAGGLHRVAGPRSAHHAGDGTAPQRGIGSRGEGGRSARGVRPGYLVDRRQVSRPKAPARAHVSIEGRRFCLETGREQGP